MTAESMPETSLEEAAFAALGAVVDPELDEPITDLGFVRSLQVDGGSIAVHLRLPTSFCSPNFAYLMASDAKDVLTALPWVDRVLVELDDHHDSDLINRGLAADAGYRGTFLHEADQSLDELRTTFRRKAHTAAMERVLTGLLRSGVLSAEPDRAERDRAERDRAAPDRAGPDREVERLGEVRLRDLPAGDHTEALLRRRAALGLPADPDAPVMVDHDGTAYPPEQVPMALRRARSTRISIDGNAHFCRGLLATRYPDEAVLLPLTVKTSAKEQQP